MLHEFSTSRIHLVSLSYRFIGVVARKQLFVMIYAYFLCVHFAINIIVGIYFLVTVRASNRHQLVEYCAEAFADTSVESSCSRLMNVSTYVFIAIVAALLLLEFCKYEHFSCCRVHRPFLFYFILFLFLLPRWSVDRSSVCVSSTYAKAGRPVSPLGLFPRLL